MTESLADYWRRVAPGLDAYIAANRNPRLEDCLRHLIAFMAHTVENVPQRATRNQHLLGTIDGLAIVAFDAVRGALQSQQVLCLVGTATAARICFEACCTVKFVAAAGLLADTYAKRYVNWMHVESLEHYRKTGQPLPWEEIIQHATQASEWLEPDSFRVRKPAYWTNDIRFPNLFVIAKHVDMEDDYRKIYESGSTFVHASSTVTRMYRVGNQLRSVPDAKHVSRCSWIAGNLALKLQRTFLEFFGIPHEQSDVADLLAKFLLVFRQLEGT